MPGSLARKGPVFTEHRETVSVFMYKVDLEKEKSCVLRSSLVLYQEVYQSFVPWHPLHPPWELVILCFAICD